MDSDSSDDDDLFTFQAFGPSKRKRQQTKKVKRGFEFLQDAMKNADARQESQGKIAQMQHGLADDAELLKQVEETIQQSKVPIPKRDSVVSGMVEDLEKVLGDERCLLLGKARDLEGSCVLGIRQVVDFDPKRIRCGHYLDFYHLDRTTTTTATYIKQLKEILRKLVSATNKTLQTAWIQPLRIASRTHKDIQFFLEQRQLCKLRQQHDLVEIPCEIMLWLFRVACSCDVEEGKVNVRSGALQTLQGLLRQNQSMNCVSPCLSLKQLSMQLQVWVPLKNDNKKEGAADDDSSSSSSNNNKETSSTTVYCKNEAGLERFFTIWNTAFEVEQIFAAAETTTTKDATTCLVLLAKLSLDKCVHSTERNFQLIQHLKYLVSNILELVQRQHGDHDNKLTEWTKETMEAIFQQFLGLGPPEQDDAEDAKDYNAWLSYGLLCRIWPHMKRTHCRKTDCQFHKTIAQFHAHLCLQTLQHFFAGKDWKEEVYTSLTNLQNDTKLQYDLVENAKSSLRWLVLCSSLVALIKVRRLVDDDDKAKCLAIVEVALGRCLEVGMELFKDPDEERLLEEAPNENVLSPPAKKKKPQHNEYATTKDAKDVAHLLGLLKMQCNYLVSRMNAMSSHFRRVGYLVQCQIKYFLDAQEDAAYLGGDRKLVQAGLDKWLKQANKGTAEDSEDDDDDDIESPTKKPRTVLSEKDNGEGSK